MSLLRHRFGRCALAAALLGVGSGGVAQAQCQVSVPAPPTEAERPEHHPVGRGLPARDGFVQPGGCTDAYWFFDQDGDGQAGPAEPRLFGPDRTVVCASCHVATPPPGSVTASETFLRQDPRSLCLVCHSI